jgi:hypothetical protein
MDTELKIIDVGDSYEVTLIVDGVVEKDKLEFTVADALETAANFARQCDNVNVDIHLMCN